MRNEVEHTFFQGMKDKGLIAGTVVVSVCGHDKQRVYIVIAEHESFLYLSDGEKRSFCAPKKKRRKHVRALGIIAGANQWLDSLASLPPEEQNIRIRQGIHSFLNGHKHCDEINEEVSYG